VLLVEDIVDSGQTLKDLMHTLRGRGPASLRSCALVHKERPVLDVTVDYLGFTIPDVWVVGYGLDYADTHRTLPYIAELKPEAYQRPSQV
jgi:hypoxanthine phosphoribosyltransferase